MGENYPVKQAAEALVPHTAHADMNFREAVVTKLVETLKQPMDVQWLVPVIKSRRNLSTHGHALTLIRHHGGDRAVPALLSCLDFDNPTTRSYYNMSIIESQYSCRVALAIPWHCDANRAGTDAETEDNRRILRILKTWVAYRLAHPQPGPPNWDAGWSEPVDGISINLSVGQDAWPEGLPQVLGLAALGAGGKGSIMLPPRPDPLEVEVNAEWYYLPEKASFTIAGGWEAYHTRGCSSLQLDGRWLRKSDDQPLVLKPGSHTVRVRLSIVSKEKLAGLVTSKPVKFEVIPAP